MEEYWKTNTLNKSIEKVVFSPSILNLTRIIAKEGETVRNWELPEQTGYFSGFVYDEVFYITNNTGLNSSSGSSVEITRPCFTSNFIYTNVSKALPNFKSVLYHSHPEVNEIQLKEMLPKNQHHIIDSVKIAIDAGLYDYVGDGGRGKLINSLTETFTRNLSEADINLTPGRYSLLISSTNHKNNLFSQINFYDILQNEPKLVDCDLMKYSDTKRIIKDLKQMKKVTDESHRELWGFASGDKNISEQHWKNMRERFICKVHTEDPRIPLEELIKQRKNKILNGENVQTY